MENVYGFTKIMKTKEEYLDLIVVRNKTVATILAARHVKRKKSGRKKKELSLNEIIMKTPKDELPALLKKMGFSL